MDKFVQLQQVGINVDTMQKGDYFTQEQVEQAYYAIDTGLAKKMERFARGEIGNPMSFAVQHLQLHIEKLRKERNLEPLVLRSSDGGIRVLTDAEAVNYLNNQANAGLRKHKAKTSQLFTHVDASNLNEHDAKSLETHQRRHAFILASQQGARAQALKMQRKGLQLPNYTDKVD